MKRMTAFSNLKIIFLQTPYQTEQIHHSLATNQIKIQSQMGPTHDLFPFQFNDSKMILKGMIDKFVRGTTIKT